MNRVSEYLESLADRLCDELDLCADAIELLNEVDDDIVLEWIDEAEGYAASEWLLNPEELTPQQLADATDLEEVVRELESVE